MFRRYYLEEKYVVDLCKIFHVSLTNAEISSMNEFSFGNFMVKPMTTVNNSYGIWFKGKYMIHLKDEPFHNFAVEIHEDNFITNEMVTIILQCMIKEFKDLVADNSPKFDKKEIKSLINDMLVANSHHFSTNEMSEFAEMLYGKENA